MVGWSVVERHGVTLGRFVALRRAELGWTQIRLAAELGHGEDWMSQVERDLQQVKDLTLLRRLADKLGSDLDELIALPQPAASRSRPRPRKGPSATLTKTSAPQEDDVRRRPFMALAAAALLNTAAGPQAARADETPLAGLEDLLLYGTSWIPSPRRDPTRGSVAASLLTSRQDFKAARYDALAKALPGRIAAAEAVGSVEERARNTARLYNLAARLCIKIGDNNLVAITSDRALASARAGGDPLVIAEAHRMVSSAWRRQGRLARATDIVTVAAEELLADTSVSEAERLATRGGLYATAAYTAAKSSDRSYAYSLIREAADSAVAAGVDDGIQGVALHELSVHYELGDAGRAIELAATIDPAALPTAERRARFFIDVARAFDQWGKPDRCYRALLAAEQAAPQEVRRGAVRDLAVGLLRHDRALPGIRDFAARAGAQV